MKPAAPDARWQSILKALQTKTPPVDQLAADVLDAHTGKTQNATYSYAFDLASERDDRDALVAFFLSGATIAETSSSLKIPEDVVRIFGLLVIDFEAFRNKLEMRRYAERYRSQAPKQGANLVELGLVQGPLALMHHFRHGHEELPIDPKVCARAMMQQAFYFGMMSRGNSIKSNVTKESLRWISATSSLLKDYDRLLGESQDSDEALLEIEKRKMTQTLDEIGITPEDVLH